MQIKKIKSNKWNALLTTLTWQIISGKKLCHSSANRLLIFQSDKIYNKLGNNKLQILNIQACETNTTSKNKLKNNNGTNEFKNKNDLIISHQNCNGKVFSLSWHKKILHLNTSKQWWKFNLQNNNYPKNS